MFALIFSSIQEQTLHHPIRSFALIIVLVPILYVVINEYIRNTARVDGFDGPPGLPLIGNIHQIRENAAEQYRKWSKTYGDVYQIQLGNIPVLVVNSAAAAKVIFGNNSQALSSRPVFYTFHKVLSNTAGTTIGTSPFNESLKRRRKGAASALNKPSVQTYLPHLDEETREFIREALTLGDAGAKPVDPTPLIQRLSLSLALTLNWGTRITSSDPLFHEITEVEDMISRFRSTTGNLQDYIPLLRLNPFSFGSVKAREMRDRRDVYLQRLNRELDDRMEKGTAEPCIQANVIMDKEAKLNAEELTSISLTMLSGGLDTITTLLQWSIALLAQRPDIQDEAVKAIREHYTAEQPLGDIEDDQKCAYVVALVRECLRYYTVLRLALPRSTVKPFTYNGKTIPAGTTIYLNAWACNMDPKIHTDPLTFSPSRWLNTPDAPLFTYGLGYRMCAGSLLANRELYLVFLRMLGCFIIEPAGESHDSVTVGKGEGKGAGKGEKEGEGESEGHGAVSYTSFTEKDVHPVAGSADATSLVTFPRPYRVFFRPRGDVGGLRGALVEGGAGR